MTAERMCQRCRQVKPVSQFHKGNSPDGLSYICKACNRVKARDYYRKNNTVHKPWMIGCDKCQYVKDCNILVKQRGQDPYCFQSNPNHKVWMREMGFQET